MILYLLYPLSGAIAGLLAGLLGVGGGVVVIPIMVFIFTAQGLPQQYIMHMALGTSLFGAICRCITPSERRPPSGSP
jgi:uncharacterized membrane protein YfcA